MKPVRPEITSEPNTAAKVWSWLRLVLTVLISLLFASCLLPDGKVSTYKDQKVGSVYVTTDKLLIVGSAADKLEISIPTFIQREEEFIPSGASGKRKRNLPSGTRIRLESVDRKGYDSWNTGAYYVYDVTIRILDGKFSNQTAEGEILFVEPDERSWGDKGVYIKKL